jgi:hypothetical protein
MPSRDLSFVCHSEPARLGGPARQVLVGLCEESAFWFCTFGLRRLDAALPYHTTLCTIVIPNPACPDEGRVAFFANGGEGSAFARLECGGSTPLCSAARVRRGAACCAHRHAVATALEMKP